MKTGLFGAGNMGGAILEAAVRSGHTVKVYDPSPAAKKRFENYKEVIFTGNETQAAADCDLLIFAVKPSMVKDVCRKISGSVTDKAAILSVAAGVRVSVYEDYFKNNGIVRAMPNLPALCGKGYTGLFFKNIDDEQLKKEISGIFGMVGEVGIFEKEEMIDKLIPVTSSSPAYICMMIEAMADGAVRLGFTRKESYKMAEQAVLGTAAYLLETGMHPAELKDRVCSPAGTTIEAVAALEESGFRNSILEAMDRCYSKVK